MIITNEELNGNGIEQVLVNGMHMFKRNDRLFLTAEAALFDMRLYSKNCYNESRIMDQRCKCVPVRYNDDIFGKICRGEVLHAIVKF